MTLDVAPPSRRTYLIDDKSKSKFVGGISSLQDSWVYTSPSPFDTMSLLEGGVSGEENTVIVSFNTASEKSSAKWFRQTIVELVRLLGLPKDWNSDNPRQIEPKSIEKILTVLLTILDSDSTPPAVVPTSRGGVQVEWHQNGIDLEIEALSSGKLEFFVSGPEGDKEGTIEGDTTILKRYTRLLKATHSLSPSM